MDDEITEAVFATLMVHGRFDTDVYTQYKGAAAVLKSKGFLNTPHVNERIFELTDLGKTVMQAGGWKSYSDKQELNEKMTLEKAKSDLKLSKIQSKYGIIPYVVSVLAFISSVIAISIAYKSLKLAESKETIEVIHPMPNHYEEPQGTKK